MDDIELNRTVPLATAVVRAMVPMRDLPAFLSHAFAAVADVLAKQRVHVHRTSGCASTAGCPATPATPGQATWSPP